MTAPNPPDPVPSDASRPAPSDAADDPVAARAARAAEAERRRRRDRVFGAVLADTTSDERGPGTTAGDRSREDELRRNVPPHHG